MSELRFYVYEHWRPDSDLCFYVGKGTGDRAYRLRGRNAGHVAIASNLALLGMCIEIRMVASGLSEEEAIRLEEERISFWTSVSVKLVNRYGVGNRSVFMTEEVRQKLRIANLGKKLSPELRGRLSEIHKRIGSVKRLPKSHPHTEESKAKIGERHKGKIVSEATRDKLRKINLGKRHSDETRALISQKVKGLKRSEETRRRIGEGHRGHIVSEETRRKISATLRAKSNKETVS